MDKKANTGVEIERKYIIKMPDVSLLMTKDEYTKSDIMQIYITSLPGETHRVRKRAYADNVRFFETRKIRIDNISSTEIEGEITEERFSELSKNILDGTLPIVKTRHTFLYDSHTFEIDIYPNWTSTAVMEIELNGREEQVEIPEFISIIKDVTGDKKYSNAAMSRSFPEEII